MLSFGPANSKLKGLETLTGEKVFTFSLTSGVNCPYAKDCKSQAIETPAGWRIQDGEHTLFRCFSASQEVLLPVVRQSRQRNTETILAAHAKGLDTLTETIGESLPAKAGIIRIHVGGDFFSQTYFDAWLHVAHANPDKRFYAYTKSLPFWVKRLGNIPANLMLTASRGGFKDKLIDDYGLIEAKVVGSEYEAKKLRLPIDHDDRHAALQEYHHSFALLIHGPQPKGTRYARQITKFNRKKAGL